LLWSACSLLLLCFSSVANCLPPQWASSFEKALRLQIERRTPYVWGAKDPERLTYDTKAKQWKRGLDCSGLVYFAGRKAALPGICVRTAHDMGLGSGGWVGVDVLLTSLEELDLIFWDWAPSDGRIDHIGVLLRDRDCYPGVAHASGTRGTVLDRFQPPSDGRAPSSLWRDYKKTRRLTIGDKK
jgi:hypothetical protein